MGIKHKAVKTTRDKGLASEWNDDHKIDGNVDFKKYQSLNHVIENRTDFPAGPVEGQIIYRTDQHTFYHWNGTVWVAIQGPATVVVAADGSGMTTDIQEGIDMLPAGGGVVYIKEGTYTINSTITATSNNVSLIGAGKSTIIYFPGDERICTVSGSNCIINNIYFKGSGLGGVPGSSLDITGASCLVSQCFFDNARICLQFTGSDNIALQNVVESVAHSGSVGFSATAGGTRSIFLGNVLNHTVGTGISINGPANCIVNNNKVSNFATCIIIRGAADNCLINGNQVISPGTTGIQIGAGIEDTDEACIIGNMVTGGVDSIVITHANNDKCLIDGNVLTGYSNLAINDSGTGTVIGTNVT